MGEHENTVHLALRSLVPKECLQTLGSICQLTGGSGNNLFQFLSIKGCMSITDVALY